MALDHVALYRKFRNDVGVQFGELRVPKRHLGSDPDSKLVSLREILPLTGGA